LLNRNNRIAVQLMIGPQQLNELGKELILRKLDYVLDALCPNDLMLSISAEFTKLANQVVEKCEKKGTSVYKWTMVFADRPASLSHVPLVKDSKGNDGYGSLGVWKRIGRGDEKFLFHCPTSLGQDEQGIQWAIDSAINIGAHGIFLDRIRFPSPANGLEFLGACACPLCRKAYKNSANKDWVDLSSLLINCAKLGSDGVAVYMEQAKPMLAFRSQAIESLVAKYAHAAHENRLRVGLDLFAPSIAFLVGQDYHILSKYADFIKPMLYCKTYAPAGLPLEIGLFAKGLEQAGVEKRMVYSFVSEFFSIETNILDDIMEKKGIPSSFARREIHKCMQEIDRDMQAMPYVYAGIELVNHPSYDTMIDNATRDSYLESLIDYDIAVCWNILYVPERHIEAISARWKHVNG